ncbi:MAG TPA: hypothetical protein VH186_29545 [Chloroflexia bacterium]|nr:hypothetical protein [Chloroflexia bacterium]
MEELINQLVAKVGLDRPTAEKVANFLKDNASEIPKWLGSSGIADKLPGGLGGMFGQKKD